MHKVKAKKHLGQHFLNDDNIAKAIVNSLLGVSDYDKILEIGPGMGVLTKFLIRKEGYTIHPVDIDKESINYLSKEIPLLKNNIILGDFLKLDIGVLFGKDSFAVIGNFPYNISSQILFRVLDYKDQIPEVVGMFQKEVAERVSNGPGSKKYGILSVLLQAFYDIEYLFTVEENAFDPPPKVKSGVIRLVRNKKLRLSCDEKLFKMVVKMAFNQRRKTLRNSLKSLISEDIKEHSIFNLRPERLSVDDFVDLTNLLDRRS